jgi:DNA ligase-1
MKPYEIIALLEVTPSTNDRKRILQEHQTNQEFVDGVTLALDPMLTFGYQKEDFTTMSEGKGLGMPEFKKLLKDLASRTLTGNAAQEEIERFSQGVDWREWNHWYQPILKKDLKCGVGLKMANSAWKGTGNEIQAFECQLASAAPEVEKITGTWGVEPKLDGVRCLAIIKQGGITLHSRNGHQFHNFKEIEDALNCVKVKNVFGYFSIDDGIILDGEIVSKNFQKLMTQVNRKKDVDAGDSIFHVFDMLTMEEWRGQIQAAHQERSRSLFYLMHHFGEAFKGKVKYQKPISIDFDSEESRQVFNEMFKKIIMEGFEGVMLKNPKAPYKKGRNKNWLKIKPFIELTMKVVGVEEGTGKNKDKLGALVCISHEEKEVINVKVGGGFSDEQREDFWKARDSIEGDLVEVRADSFTEPDKSGEVSLRFPRFLRFRNTAGGGEKI